MNGFRARLFFASCCFVFIGNCLQAQSYTDGPIQLQAKVREVQVTLATNSDFTLTVGPLPLGPYTDDEYTFKVYARDDQDLDGAGYTGGTCLRQNFVTVPNTSADFNQTIFNYTYPTATVPQYMDINIDAWEDDIASDFVPVSGLTACGDSNTFNRCAFNGLFCCANIPFVGCVYEGDDERCNPAVFVDNLNYRNGPPCQWTDQGFLNGSCGATNWYKPRIETFWRYTRGTSCANAIPLGNVSPGFGSYTHYNSNECYSNNFATSPGNDVFYAINVTAATGVTVSLCGGATWNTYLYLLDGSCTSIASDDDGCGLNTSVLSYGICTPGTYYIVVDGATALAMGTFTVVVTENPSLVPAADAGSNQTICAGQGTVIGATIPVSGGLGPYGYAWTPTTNLSNPAIANPIASPTTTTTYTLTVTDSRGCVSASSMQVIVTAPPVPTLGANQVVCPGSPITLSAGPGYTQYFWSTGTSGVSSINVSTPGTYAVTVIDVGGCIGADTITISNFVPSGLNLGPDQSICTGSSLTLTAPSGMNGYNWSTGASGVNTINVSTAGTYSVTISDVNGCSVEDTIVVGVDPLPTVSLGANYSICPGGTTILDAGTGFVGYIWNTSATSSTVTAGPGAYTVTVTDVNGCENTASITIGAYPAPSVALGPDYAFCEGSSTSLSGPAGMASYNWNTGATTQSIAPSFPGTYMLTITDANGCEAADTVVLNWNASPSVSAGPDVSFCGGSAGQTVTATAGFASYLWNTGDNTAALTITVSGTYSVIATDANGCVAYDTLVATVFAPAFVDLGADTVAICDSGSVMLDAGPGAATYAWSGSAADDQYLFVNTSGTYFVTVTNPGGCFAVDSVVVIATGASQANLLPATAEFCENSSLGLDPGAGYLSYDWNNGASIAQILSVDTAGTYFVEVIDGNGCRFLDTIAVTAVLLPDLEVADVILCPGETATLSAGPGFTNYLWSTGATTQTINAVPVGNYNVTVTLGNCELSDEADVSDDCNSSIQIPNVFTPNGDGVNDFFVMTGVNVETVDYWIADRWGRILFTGNALTAQWDGKLNGNDLPEGVYYLAIRYKYKDEIKTHNDELPVTLFR